jgi:hypothetical protein
MKTPKHLLFIAVIFLSAVLHTRAQEPVQPQSAVKYRMELVYIFEASSTEFIFVMGNAGFKSVASLKNYLGNLPPGSTLEWAPGCERLGGEPLLSSELEMDEFKAFCAEKNINFVLVPSGWRGLRGISKLRPALTVVVVETFATSGSILSQEMKDRELTLDPASNTIQIPVEIVSIRLNGKEVHAGAKIKGNDDWLQGLHSP